MKRRHLLVGFGSAAVGGSALMGTGAFTAIQSDRAAVVNVAGDAAGWLGLQPADGPNGDYALVRNQQLELDVSGDNSDIPSEGVNADSTGRADRVFTVTNQGTQAVEVWITDESDRVTFTSTTDDHGVIEGEDNSKTVPVGNTIAIGFEVDTQGNAAGDTILDGITVHASADGATAPGGGTGENPQFTESSVSVSQGDVAEIGVTTGSVDTIGLQVGGDQTDYELAAELSGEAVTPAEIIVGFDTGAAGSSGQTLLVQSADTELTELIGVGDQRASQLENEGYDSVLDVAAATADVLSTALNIDTSSAQDIIDSANSLLLSGVTVTQETSLSGQFPRGTYPLSLRVSGASGTEVDVSSLAVQ